MEQPTTETKVTVLASKETVCSLSKQLRWRLLPPGEEGGYCQKNRVTLFKTNICDFPNPSYDLTLHLLPHWYKTLNLYPVSDLSRIISYLVQTDVEAIVKGFC